MRVLVVAAATLLVSLGSADAAMGPAVQVSQGGFAATPQPIGSISAVASSGRQLVVWSAATEEGGNSRVWGRIVDERGVPAGDQFPISDGAGGDAPIRAVPTDVAARGRRGEFLVVWWEELPGQRSRIVARRVGADGRLLAEPFAIASGSDGGSPAIVYGKRRREFMAVWDELTPSGRLRVFGGRIPGGSSETPRPFRISASWELVDAITPRVAYDARRGTYMAVWQGEEGVRGRTLPAEPGGSRGRSRRLSVRLDRPRSGFYMPTVKYRERTGNYVAAWTGAPEDGAGWAAYARLVGRGGRPRGPERLVSGPDASGTAPFPAAVSDIEAVPGRRHFMLALGEPRTEEQSSGEVFVRRLGASLRPGRLRRVATDNDSFSLDLAYSNVQEAFRAVWIQREAYDPERGEPPTEAEVFTRQL